MGVAVESSEYREEKKNQSERDGKTKQAERNYRAIGLKSDWFGGLLEKVTL